MNRRERRALRVHERAKVDQIQAGLRDESLREAGSLFHLLRYSDAEVQCCWCDCPLEDHQVPGYTCSGCPDRAVYAADQFGRGVGYAYPLCRRHFRDFQDNYVPGLFAQAKRIEIRTYDAYDADLA